MIYEFLDWLKTVMLVVTMTLCTTGLQNSIKTAPKSAERGSIKIDCVADTMKVDSIDFEGVTVADLYTFKSMVCKKVRDI